MDGKRRSVERVPGTDDVYLVDGLMFGQTGQVAVYLIDSPEPAVVDTGTADTTPDAVFAALDELGIEREELRHIIPTHVHLDHAGGAGKLANACPNATVHCHERGIDFLTDPELLERLRLGVNEATGISDPYGVPDLVPEASARPLGDGDVIDLGDRALDVIDAPGHAPHQHCFFDRKTDVLFTADGAGMLFDDRIYPTTQPPSFDLEDALETAKRLQSFEPAVNCYPHFGVDTAAMQRLREYEAMLPEWVSAVEAAAEAHDDVGGMAELLRPEWGSMGLEGDISGVLGYLERS